MNDPQHTLTVELQQTICAYIRAGAFPQIAAEAAGIPQKVFDRWMRFGQAARPVPLYRDFVLAVRQAQAQARLVAENHALKQAPLTWLKSGPGKETTRMPGWTSPVRPPTPPRKGSGMSAQRTMELISCLLTALEPFPEARLAAADMLEKGGWTSDPNDIPEESSPQSPALPIQDEKPIPQPEAETPVQPSAVAPVAAPVTGLEERPVERQPVETMPQRREEEPPRSETRAQPNYNENATNCQPTDREVKPRPASPGTAPSQKRPSAWDSLDAGHWIVFSSP